jgi:hypothetical protein
MHTEIRFHGDPPRIKSRTIIPARSPKQAAETERQLRALHVEYIRRMEAVKARLFNR